MKTYVETLTCPTSASQAWAALKEMNLWLPTLSTNRAVNYDRSGDFFYQGRTYEVVTREGITMDSEIYLVDELKKKVEIHASHSILKSLLTCSVERIDDHRCKLTRTQAYPGVFGFVFATFFDHRESGETSEYLEAWAHHAQMLTRPHVTSTVADR